MKKNLLYLLVIPALVLLSGCVSDDDFKRQDMRINTIQLEIRDLKNQVRLRDLELDRQLGQTRQNLPDLRLELDRMRSEVQRLTNMVEVTEQRGVMSGGEALSLKDQMVYINARLDRLESTLRLPPMSPPTVSTPGAATAAPASTDQPAPADAAAEPGDATTATPPPAAPAEAPSAPAASDEADYKVAEALYKQEVYQASLDKFRGFIQQYPRSSYAPSAQFYIGECLYQLKNYEEAILEYQKLIKTYPQSNKVSIALLKQAYSFLNIGDKTSAKLLMQKIVREYPDSYSAGVAKQKLPQIR